MQNEWNGRFLALAVALHPQGGHKLFQCRGGGRLPILTMLFEIWRAVLEHWRWRREQGKFAAERL